MTARRVTHLLWNEPRLFIHKSWQRLKRLWHYVAGSRYALSKSQTGLARTVQEGDGDLLSVLTQALPVVVLERRRNYVACGIRASDILAVLSTVSRVFPNNAGLLVDGRPLSLSPVNRLRQSFRAARVDFRTPDRTMWHFNVYDLSDEGSYVSRSRSDIVAGVLYCGVFDRPGVSELAVRMPELAQGINSLPIDIVYTWVDSSDPAWKKAFAEARHEDSAGNGDAKAESRFHSSDELRYSLRSVDTYLPWVRTIHIVSNCSPPDWLNAGHPRLRWVLHDEILDSSLLPTFNSHAIEASLHRVPDVAENFLYFNDDFFAFDELAPGDFVNENGTLNANLERLAVVNSQVDPNAPDYLNAARNSARLLYERHGYYPTRLHRHTPYSLSRPLLEQLEGEFEQAFTLTRRARFRSVTDISVASFLAHHYGFLRREVVYADYPAELVKSNDPFFAFKMQKIAGAVETPKIVCLNEGGTPSARWRRQLARFMANHFSIPGPWERVQ